MPPLDKKRGMGVVVQWRRLMDRASMPAPPQMSVAEEIARESLKLVLEDCVVVERNARPAFLTNPDTGHPLELDFYLPDCWIGIEIQGQHHYDDMAQMRRDDTKRQLMARAGLFLIELSTFQIDPGTLNRALYRGFMQMGVPLHFLRPFSDSWLEFKKKRCIPYRKGILARYGKSEATTSPQTMLHAARATAARDEILRASWVTFNIHGVSLRGQLLRPIGKKSFVVRPFGTTKELFLKRKDFEPIR